nr:hypothetical protein [Streptomyces californicus]
MTADGTTTYTSDAAGHLTRTALPNTETEERTYDRAGRVTAVTATKAGTAVTKTCIRDSTKTALTLSAAGLPTRVEVTRAAVGTGGYEKTYVSSGFLRCPGHGRDQCRKE